MKTAEELIREGEEVMARGTCCPWAGFLQRNWPDIRAHLLDLQALRAADKAVHTKSAQQAGMETMSEEDLREFWRKHHRDMEQDIRRKL